MTRMRYRFDELVLDTDRRELHAADRVAELQPQVFDVLVHLVENRDRVVHKEELLDVVWGSQFVTESALTTRIKEARRAVGDDGQAQRVIRTVRGHGYRFVADTRIDELDETARRSGAAPDVPVVEIDKPPRTRYATSDGLSIAYQVFGDGPALVFIAGFTTNVELMWEHPGVADTLRRLGCFARVVVFDKRGTGLSDRLAVDAAPTLEQRADDLRVVMEATGVDRATVLGSSEGGALAMVFAATHPERVERLALHDTWVTGDMAERFEDVFERVQEHWGKGVVYGTVAPAIASTPTGREFLARYERGSATPRIARQFLELIGEIDVASVLPTISAPTLVMHARNDTVVPFRQGEQLAEGIPGARLIVLPGSDHYLLSGDTTAIVSALEEFMLGVPAARAAPVRVLATVLFVDIVDSTELLRRIGDSRFADLLDNFDAITQRCVNAERGEHVKSTGDGFVALFDGPARAARAACAVRDAALSLGVRVTAGLHTSEVERRARDVTGIGVHIASRVEKVADPGEVWATSTVRDLAAGSGIRFEERGHHTLKGFDQPFPLYEVTG
jgi:pimeloyl-ACP methyl ester carboxylesterase/DNA-binding winged helix-turn-helix (wHTH) protein